MSHPIVKTYEEACKAVTRLGILPLSATISDHPSLTDITEASAWHTGLETDPWRWRNRFATEGIAAYGRFIGSKPFLVSRELFPLFKCALAAPTSLDERYAAGTLARPVIRLHEIIQQHEIIDVRALRKQAGMQHKIEKNAFDRALIDLQNTADIVMSGTASNRNEPGATSGWDGTCYMLAENWMDQHNVEPCTLTRIEAREQLFARLQPHWEKDAILYLQKKIV
jgi:hypothetical protein